MSRYMERKIAEQCIADLLDAGFSVSVENGGEQYELTRSTDPKAILDAMFLTDEDYLVAHSGKVRSPNSDVFGWVRFIYGNDGWDVINDYSVNLEETLKRTLKLSEDMSE